MNVRRQVIPVEGLIERKLPSRLLKAQRFDLTAGHPLRKASFQPSDAGMAVRVLLGLVQSGKFVFQALLAV